MSKVKFLERFDNVGLNLPDHSWDKAIEYDVNKDHASVTRSRHFADRHLSYALTKGGPYIREIIAQHPNATKEHLDIAIKDVDPYVRRAVAEHPNATKEHLDIAINDDDPYVQEAAESNPNYKKFFPNGH